MSSIYLIDGSGYIFRAYYAIRSLSTSKGFPTNAIYGFTQMLWKFLKMQAPTHCAVIFDSKEFLNTDIMLAALVVIGGIGFLFERLVFGSLERATVLRWGMMRVAKG